MSVTVSCFGASMMTCSKLAAWLWLQWKRHQCPRSHGNQCSPENSVLCGLLQEAEKIRKNDVLFLNKCLMRIGLSFRVICNNS